MQSAIALLDTANPPVLVLGHGLLAEITGQSRVDLANEMARRLEGRPVQPFETMAEMYKKRFGLNGLIRLVRDATSVVGQTPVVFQHLAQWPSHLVIDLTWCDLFDRGCRTSGLSIDRLVTEDDLAYLYNRDRTIVYLRGLRERPDSLILTHDHFDKAIGRHGQPGVWQYTADQIRSRPLIGLGLSFEEIGLLHDYLFDPFMTQPARGKTIALAHEDAFDNEQLIFARAAGWEIFLLASSLSDTIIKMST
ncbi:hypothetical protein KJ596_01225 [Patescibacteria group bacterium]|nr:hypothetical protein [Patescibacteria group bacterium]MBU1868045.1 hypothetical protein [Patescibacteria group bacterium]